MTFSYHDFLGYLQLWPTYFFETRSYVKKILEKYKILAKYKILQIMKSLECGALSLWNRSKITLELQSRVAPIVEYVTTNIVPTQEAIP